ncbi:MAG: hypothetical protein JXO22_17340 [Phycisphaerae bacterium]|nr:hypothetical protein [Phycisphaerae bacterium]
MSSHIKCSCPNCGAKYRLPQEAQGRAARCKACATKFKVPVVKSLEDSVIDWLADPADMEDEIEQPRVINMPKRNGASDSGAHRRGPIRLRSGEAAEDESKDKPKAEPPQAKAKTP